MKINIFLRQLNLKNSVEMPSLRTLIPGLGSFERARNTQDNEENVPGLSWSQFARQYGLRRTFSANEMDFYDEDSGRRSPFSRSNSSIHLRVQEAARRERRERRAVRTVGISDEYIPDMIDFNPSKFGVTWEPETPKESLHAKVKPIEIAQNGNGPQKGIFQITDEVFHIAKSPERDPDRIVLSSLPKHFNSLSFSERRKMLNEIIPEAMRSDGSYKDHITKIIRKNTASSSNNTSPNISRRNSILSPRTAVVKPVEPNVNQMGSLICNSWSLGKVINRGAFGVIRECKRCPSSTACAAFPSAEQDEHPQEQTSQCFKLVNYRKSLPYLRRLKRELISWAYLSEFDIEQDLIIKLLDFHITPDYIFMRMPVCNEGSLFDKVKIWESSRVTLRSRIKLVMKYIAHSAKCIKFVHDNGVVHGDIKLENFLLLKDKPILCDFGMADFTNKFDPINCKIELVNKINTQCQAIINKLMKSETSKMNAINSVPNFSTIRDSIQQLPSPLTATGGSSNRLKDLIHMQDSKLPDELIGSLPYAAPELLKPSPRGITKACDVWAFGIMCYSIVMFQLPFFHSFEPRLKVMILEGNWRNEEWDQAIKSVDISGLDTMAQTIDEIITGCLEKDENLRWNIDTIVDKLKSFTNI